MELGAESTSREERSTQHIQAQTAKIERFFDAFRCVQQKYKDIFIKDLTKQVLECSSSEEANENFPIFRPSTAFLSWTTDSFGRIVKEDHPERRLFLRLESNPNELCAGSIIICRVDSADDMHPCSVNDLKVLVQRVSDKSLIAHEVKCGQNARQVSQISFVCHDQEAVDVFVFFYGEHIQNSPLRLDVVHAPPSARTGGKFAAVEIQSHSEHSDDDLFSDSSVDYESDNVATTVKEVSSADSSSDDDVVITVNAGQVTSSPVQTSGFQKGEVKKSIRRPLCTNTETEVDDLNAMIQELTGGKVTLKMDGQGDVGVNNICRQMDSFSMKTMSQGGVNFMSLVKSGKLKLKSSIVFTNNQVTSRSIGGCFLRSGEFIISGTLAAPYKVWKFGSTGALLNEITSQVRFFKPATTVELHSGKVAIISDKRIHILDVEMNEPSKILSLPDNANHYGLTQDSSGRLVTIQERRGSDGSYLICLNTVTSLVEQKIKIISNTKGSKCRFLSNKNGKFYVTDLGLNKVYVISESGEAREEMGKKGKGDDQFDDAAGTVVDDFGNFIVADSRNHKLALYSAELKFVCKVELDPPTRRPSDICISSDGKSLMVLNLHGLSPAVIYPLQ